MPAYHPSLAQNQNRPASTLLTKWARSRRPLPRRVAAAAATVVVTIQRRGV